MMRRNESGHSLRVGDTVEHRHNSEPVLRGEVIEVGEREVRLFDTGSPTGSRFLFWVDPACCVRVKGS